MGTYEGRGNRPKKRNGSKEGAYHFLEDKLVAALFVHHRDLLPRELEMRLLPVPVGAPTKIVKVWRNKRTPKVICLPDRSNAPYAEVYLPPKRKATIIIKEACEKHNITVTRFMSNDRLADSIAARREACYLIAKETNMSVPAIGRFIKRDHSTVMHAIQRYCDIYHVPYPRRRLNEARHSGEPLSREHLPEMAE